jgi:hypothetical protein
MLGSVSPEKSAFVSCTSEFKHRDAVSVQRMAESVPNFYAIEKHARKELSLFQALL